MEIEFYISMEKLNKSDLPSLKPVSIVRARYSREISFEGGRYATDTLYKTGVSGYRIPDGWRKALAQEHLIRMWVECAVQVGADGTPADAPLRNMRPIALQTDAGLYLVTQGIERVYVKHGYNVQFNKPVFTIRPQQQELEASSVKALVDAYGGQLRQCFSNGLLQAREDTINPQVPGEFHFRRDRESSKVLEGFAGPYRELSYYVVRWYRLPADLSVLYTLSPLHKGGYGAPGSQIVVHVSQSLTVSVGASKEYSEPTPEQGSKYAGAVGTTMQCAMDGTAALFKGKKNESGYVIDAAQIISK